MRLAVLGVAVALVGGCAAMGGRLLNASDALEERTERFYDELSHDQYGSGPSVRDAEDLAKAAVDFRRAVERDSPREDLDPAFDRIARPYHALREYYDDRPAHPAERDRFNDVTEAYLDLEGALKYRLSEFSTAKKMR